MIQEKPYSHHSVLSNYLLALYSGYLRLSLRWKPDSGRVSEVLFCIINSDSFGGFVSITFTSTFSSSSFVHINFLWGEQSNITQISIVKCIYWAVGQMKLWLLWSFLSDPYLNRREYSAYKMWISLNRKQRSNVRAIDAFLLKISA